MKSVRLQKLGRFYIWVILLVLTIVIFILLRSPAAGHDKASNAPQGLTVANLLAGNHHSTAQLSAATENAAQRVDNTDDKSNQSNHVLNSSNTQVDTDDPEVSQLVPPHEDEFYPGPSPIEIPAPVPYPKVPPCPMYLDGPGPIFFQRYCPPCPPWPTTDWSMRAVCLHSE